MLFLSGGKARGKEKRTMNNYSIEDIELIRRKSGITYEEAVSLLDYHSGDVARVLIDLERNGRLKEEKTNSAEAGKTVRSGEAGEKNRGPFLRFLQKMYRTRVKVHKDKTVIINLSALFVALAVILFSPHLAIVSLILSLILGYRISIDTNDEAFQGEDLKEIVSGAAANVKRTVSDISREINDAARKAESKKAKEEKAESRETGEEKEELKQKETAGEIRVEPKRKAEEPARPLNTRMPDLNGSIVRDLEKHENGANVPTLQVPVKVESSDGNVEVSCEGGGYHSATIG